MRIETKHILRWSLMLAILALLVGAVALSFGETPVDPEGPFVASPSGYQDMDEELVSLQELSVGEELVVALLPFTSAVEPDPSSETSEWLSYRGNGFEFGYPRNLMISELTGTNLPKEGPPRIQVGGVTIVVPVERDRGFNSSATILTDYASSYLLGESYEQLTPDGVVTLVSEVDIHDSESLSGVFGEALRQRYSAGSRFPDGSFYAGDEYDESDYLRYVFWDGEEQFSIMKTRMNDELLDQIARTFSFVDPPQS